MITDEIKKLIEENAVAFSTVNEKGNPHCITIAYLKVISKDQILITDNYMKSTIENIKRNPNVVLTVWNKEWKENCVGYSLEGNTQYFIEGEWYEKIKQIPENKDEPCKGAILVTINNIKKLA